MVLCLLLALNLLSLAGCLGRSPRDAAFEELLSVDEINNLLGLQVEQAPGSFQDGDTFALLLNRSNQYVSFDPGYGSRLFVYDEAAGSWVEIPNLVEYFGDEDVLEPKSGGLSSWVHW